MKNLMCPMNVNTVSSWLNKSSLALLLLMSLSFGADPTFTRAFGQNAGLTPSSGFRVEFTNATGSSVQASDYAITFWMTGNTSAANLQGTGATFTEFSSQSGGTCTSYQEMFLNLPAQVVPTNSSYSQEVTISTKNGTNISFDDDFSQNNITRIHVYRKTNGNWVLIQAAMQEPARTPTCADMLPSIFLTKVNETGSGYYYNIALSNAGASAKDMNNYRFRIDIPYSSAVTGWSVGKAGIQPWNSVMNDALYVQSSSFSNGINSIWLSWSPSTLLYPSESYLYNNVRIFNANVNNLSAGNVSSSSGAVPPIDVKQGSSWVSTSSSSGNSSSSEGTACPYVAPTGSGTGEDKSLWTGLATIELDPIHSGFELTEDVCDYPLLVRLNTQNFDFSTDVDGKDLRFVDNQGRQLHHELENWNSSAKEAAVWVRIPSVQYNGVTSVRMYFGNANAIKVNRVGDPWAGGFSLVNHYIAGTDLLKDATANNNHGSATAWNTTERPILGESSMIAGSVKIPKNYTVPNSTSLSLSNAVTMSAWVYLTGNKGEGAEQTILRKRGQIAGETDFRAINYQMNLGEWNTANDTRLCGLFYDTDWQNTCGWEQSMRYGWRFLTVAMNQSPEGVVVETFMDGERIGPRNGTLKDGMSLIKNNANLTIGGDQAGGNNLLGLMDELRLSSVARSASWIKLDYQTQRMDARCVRIYSPTIAQSQWKYSRTLLIDTRASTGEAISEPVYGSAVPLRLNALNFPFSEADAAGGDLRILDANGRVLDMEIEHWDNVALTAVLWLKVPAIRPNELQSLKLLWGNSASSLLWRPSWVWECARATYHMASNTLGSDKSNLRNHLTLPTSPVPYAVDGIIGSGVTTPSNALYALHNPSLSVNHQVTLSAWVYSTSNSPINVENTIFRKRVDATASANYQFTLGNYETANDNRLELLSATNGNYYKLNSPSNIGLNGWHLVTGTTDLSNSVQGTFSVQLYVDGVLVGSTTRRAWPEPNDAKLFVGANYLGQSAFQGKLDELRILGNSMTAPQILLDYLATKPGSRLVQLDDGSGTGYGKVTYYYGNGLVTEAEERIEPATGSTQVINNFPGNIGRQTAMGNEFYIKDHLGSVVTAVDANGVRVSGLRDWFAFGREEKVVVTAGQKITESFTGKELDEMNPTATVDGNGMYYFGARYYDADLAMWNTPDVMRQYFSPYEYAGNSPVNRVDPDGSADVSVTRKEYYMQDIKAVSYVLNLNAVARHFRDNPDKRGDQKSAALKWIFWNATAEALDLADTWLGGGYGSTPSPILRREASEGKVKGAYYNVGMSLSIGLNFGGDGNTSRSVAAAGAVGIGALGNLSDEYCNGQFCGRGFEVGIEATPTPATAGGAFGLGLEETTEIP